MILLVILAKPLINIIMRNITQIVILFSFFSFSCHNNDIQNGILESRIESPNQYVERNVGLIKNLEKFI